MRTVYLLGSYYYLQDVDVTAELRKRGRTDVDFFGDSGAFTAASTGAPIDIDAYGEWLLRHAGVLNCAAGLDVIGDPVASSRNFDRLAARVGYAVTLVPTFHVGSPWAELERLCRAYRYVALGGAVGLSRRADALTRWLVHAHRIARDHDTRLHGFGLTRPPIPWLLPWYSVDSAYWQSASRTGMLSLWDGRRFVKFRVGTSKALAHSSVIRRYGGDPREVCARGFGRDSLVGERGRQDRTWMETASVRSWRAYEAYIRNRRGPVLAPPGTRTCGDGLKIYFAVGGLSDLDLALSAATMKVTTHADDPS